MNYQKIIISPFKENLGNEQTFLNEKCNIILNKGNEILIDFHPSLFLPSPRSKNSNYIHNSNISFNQTIIKNLDLKILICNSITEQIIKPEMLILYFKIGEKYIILNDGDVYSLNNNINSGITSGLTSGLNSEMRSTELPKRKIQSNHSSSNHIHEIKITNLYYKICNYTQKVVIDIYKNKIEKIILNLSITCSVYMLKYIIYQKLKIKNIDFIKNHNIYGVGFIDTENIQFIKKAQTNKKFNDNNLIYDIMIYYMEPSRCKDKFLNLILIENSPDQCYIGLDFKFNIMRNFKKLDKYDNNAPSYRNVSDGLNLFIYCLNKKCELYNNYFIVNVGYGNFDIFSTLNDIVCPLCNSKNISLRNLGMINSKWSYRGFLKSIKSSKINGDGITLDNGKLFVIKEIIFENHFFSLFFEVEFYQIKVNIENSNNIKNSFQSSIYNIESNIIQSSSDISESDLISVNLEQKYFGNEGNKKSKKLLEVEISKEFTFQKKNESKKKEENNNGNHNDKDIMKLFDKKSSKDTKKIGEECEIQIDYKKEKYCYECGKFSNSSCYLF